MSLLFSSPLVGQLPRTVYVLVWSPGAGWLKRRDDQGEWGSRHVTLGGELVEGKAEMIHLEITL